ncbi:MAG: glycosyltransferase [Dehalococcoidales bacterium]|nr:glycosyltransferase [Dehalococcoidales bacterium]
MPKIIAGMPAYNEGKYIGTLVLQTRRHVDEVIVVDDGSTDSTAEIAELAGARVIKHGSNRGYGAAIQSIFAEARKLDPDVLVVLDADAQHSPKEIPSLVKPITDGFDCVIGSRHEHGKKIPFYRRVGQNLILRSVKTLSADKLTDSECGFRAFSRKAVQTLELRENGMAVSAETVAEASQKNLKVVQVPVSVTYGKDSSTLHPVRHGLSVFTRILAMISDQRPLFFFGLGGLIFIIVGLVFGIRVIALFTDTRVLPTGNTLVAALLIGLGLMFIITGFVLSVLQPGTHNRGLFSRIVTKISEPHPLLYFGIIGLVLVIVGLVFSVRVVSLYAANGVLPTGTALVSVALLIMGMFSIFAGLILRGFARWRK